MHAKYYYHCMCDACTYNTFLNLFFVFHSFIHSGYLYSAPSRNLLRCALSPATGKEKCLKKLVERRHIVPGQQAQCKREFIPSGGANNRESSTLLLNSPAGAAFN